MPFPEKTYLTRPVRRLIMACLVLSFFILAPLVLLYTMGYRFDLATQSIKTTGVLNIDILPKRATVKINDVILDDTMPIKLFNRAPGTYTVEISADGYHTWKKDIRIESNQTTYIKGLTLFADNTPPEISGTTEVVGARHIFFAPNGNKSIMVLPTTTTQEIHLVDNASAERYSSITTTPLDSTINVMWSDNGEHAAIVLNEQTQKRLFTISTNSEQTKPLTEIIIPTSTPLHYQWTDTLLSSASLFVGTSTLSTKITNETLSPLNYPSSTAIWYTADGNDVWSYSTTTRSLSRNGEMFFSSLDADTILFATESAALIKTGNQHTHITKEWDGAQRATILPGPHSIYIPQTREWVLYSPYEIALLYADGTYNTIYRTDEPILSVLALEDTGVILITKKNQLIGFNPGFYTSQLLLQTDNIESVGVDQSRRTIYFYGTHQTKRNLHSLQY